MSASVHEQEYSDAHWSDTVLRERVKNTFSGSRRTDVRDEICENVSRNYGDLKETTPLFFYSLFILTNYPNFADAVDDSAPSAAVRWGGNAASAWRCAGDLKA